MLQLRNTLSGHAGIGGFLLLLSILLYIRPYHGIRHDSLLYLGQSLLELLPEQLGKDIFFEFGSQARFSLFPSAIAILLEHFPVGPLFYWLTLAGRVAFFVASYLVIWRLFPERLRFWALLGVLAMAPGYGARYLFAYSEAFLTARTLAEPLALVALALALYGRWVWSGSILLLGLFLHPPQIVPVVLLVYLIAVLQDRRRWPVAFFAVILAALALIETETRRLATLRYDAQWLEWAMDASPHVFLTKWRLSDWCHLLADIFLVALALGSAHHQVRLVAKAALTATVLSLAFNAVLVDALHLVMPTGLQMWRIQWILHWLAMATLPMHLFALHEAGPSERPRLLMLLGIAVLGAQLGTFSSPIGVLVLAPLYFVWPHIHGIVRPALAQALMLLLGAALLLSFASYALTMIAMSAYSPLSHASESTAILLSTHPAILIPLSACANFVWQNTKARARFLLAALMGLTTMHAIARWDQRTEADRFVENSAWQSSAFGIELEPAAQVIWTDHLLPTWLVLGRPNYLSEWQMSGLIFNRETARVAQLRAEELYVLGYAHATCRTNKAVTPYTLACPMSEDVVTQTCERANGKLSYVVMPYALKTGIAGEWTTPPKGDGEAAITYRMYACRHFL